MQLSKLFIFLFTAASTIFASPVELTESYDLVDAPLPAGPINPIVPLKPATPLGPQKANFDGLFEQEFATCGDPTDLGQVQQVFYDLENPKIGKPMVITTTTLFKETVAQGAFIKVAAKLGPVTVNVETYNLCEFILCPIRPGVHTYSITIKVPGRVPPIKLGYVSESYTADEKRMTCIKGAFNLSN